MTNATGEHVRVRCLVSAVDADTLWDLRCLVRERLVEWLRDRRPRALPRIRTEIERGFLMLPTRDNGRTSGSGARGARTG